MLESVFHSPLTDKELQELLCVHGYAVSLDGSAGPATKYALRRFKTEQLNDSNPDDSVPDMTRFALMSPWIAAENIENQLVNENHATVSEALLAAAGYFLALKPMEIGGNNMGPWVRYFSGGAQGEGTQWCAHFAVRTVLKQTEKAVIRSGKKLGYPAGAFCHAWTPAIATAAQSLNRCIKSEDVDKNTTKVYPGMLFLVRGTERVCHVGIVMDFDTKSGIFESIEGNAPDPVQGPIDRVHRRFRNYRASPYYFVDLR
jgi:hypothetical protein